MRIELHRIDYLPTGVHVGLLIGICPLYIVVIIINFMIFRCDIWPATLSSFTELTLSLLI